VLCVATGARADNEADYQRLFEEGRAAIKDGKYAQACTAFSKAYALFKRPAVELNLGECAEREGKLRRAWELFTSASKGYERNRTEALKKLSQSPGDAEAKRDIDRAEAGAKLAVDLIAKVTPKLATVVISIAAPEIPGLSIRVGDRLLAPAPELVELVDAGTLAIAATASGYEPHEQTLTVTAGARISIAVPALVAAGGNNDIPQPVVRTGGRRKSRVRLAFALGGVGGASVVVASVVGLSARSQYKDAEKNCVIGADGRPICDDANAAKIDSALDKADIATVVGIGGAVLLVGGAVLYLTAPRERITVAPLATPTTAGVSISGRF
jgi:hypothetical protein